LRVGPAAASAGKRADAAGFRRYAAAGGAQQCALAFYGLIRFVPTVFAVKPFLPALRDRRAARWRLRAAAAAIALCFNAPAAALGLGAPELASHLGQPLALRVPLTSEDGGDLGPQCLRLVNQPDGDLPGLGAARVSLERGAGGTSLRITSLQPVHEPALRIALEIGCNRRVRKEFTVLLDPPPIAVAPPPSAAVEFGAPQVLGARGQPLLVTVPILAAPPLAPECVRAARSDSADPPRVLNDARAALIVRDGRRALRLHTPAPVYDERVRVIVELGCEQPLRHEFALLLEAPRPAANAEAAAAPTQPAPPRRLAKPAPRPKPAAAPPAVAAAPKETPLDTAPPNPTADTPQPQSRPAPAAIDRLVLAAPDEERRPGERPPTAESDVLRQVEVLSAEVKQLRAELEAANRRYRELEARRDTTGYAWAAGLAAVLLFGVGLLLGRRPRAETERAHADSAGPLTRILGQPQAERRAAAAPAAVAEAAAAPATEPAPRTDGTAIQVTEIGDTTQVIGELYATFIAPPPTQPAPQTKTEIALDLDLSQERTSMLAPQTKTEIAVDIDLGERETEIARRIEREYERIARGRVNPDPSTPAGNTTLPMTRGLDLDLDLSSLPKPPKPE
jgi:hypothetical protein